jgi:hypothetical protein
VTACITIRCAESGALRAEVVQQLAWLDAEPSCELQDCGQARLALAALKPPNRRWMYVRGVGKPVLGDAVLSPERLQALAESDACCRRVLIELAHPPILDVPRDSVQSASAGSVLVYHARMQTTSARVRARIRRTVVGIAAAAALMAAAPPLALAAGDALASYGPSTVHVPFSRAYAFAVSCAALPCTIKLTEHATAKGRRVAGLDKTNGPPITMTQQPSAGPEPHCSEQEEAESFVSGTCARKEAWEEQQANEIFAVWFVRSDINGKLLRTTLKRDRTVVLHVTATLTDATGKQIDASRPIALRLAQTAAQRRRQEQHEAEEEKRKENSPRGKAERAEDEYCTNVLGGEYGGSLVSNGHVYTRCDVGLARSRHEVTVNETETRG